MSPVDLAFHVAICVALLVAARQDLRSREVSNWISIPLFFCGAVAVLFNGDWMFVILFALFVVIALVGGYGAADGKIMAGLTGLWPLVVLPAMIVLPAFHSIWRKKNESPAPLTVSIAAAAVLTVLLEFGKIFFEKRLSP